MHVHNPQTLPSDYGSPQRVRSCQRILAEYDQQVRAGRPLGPSKAYLASLLRQEIAYASISGAVAIDSGGKFRRRATPKAKRQMQKASRRANRS